LEAASCPRLRCHRVGLHLRTGPVTTVLHAARWADVDAGEVLSPAAVVVDGDRIQAINPR
jgi:hypothetical protein